MRGGDDRSAGRFRFVIEGIAPVGGGGEEKKRGGDAAEGKGVVPLDDPMAHVMRTDIPRVMGTLLDLTVRTADMKRWRHILSFVEHLIINMEKPDTHK